MQKQNNGFIKNPFLYLLMIFLLVTGFQYFFAGRAAGHSQQIKYSELVQEITNDNVKEITYQPSGSVIEVSGVYKTAKTEKPETGIQFFTPSATKVEKFTSIILPSDTTVADLQKLAGEHQTQVEVKHESSSGMWINILVSVVPFAILFFFLFSMMGNMGGNSGRNPMSFGRSKAKAANKEDIKVRFSDVAGAEEEKQELVEVVEFLKDPRKFTALGARIPAGVLLEGPPGTGKTLLAKAVAGEANVPFFSISGSEFVEMFVGLGASRVRDLFENAKKNAPAIIFIDEIDAVGRQRGTGMGGGHDEREQTLNQLLVEMDGFEGTEGVIVIAATNRSDVLDPALLRPGRFDRQILVGRPDVKGREAILKVHARNKKLAKEVDLKVIAQQTPGFSGAELENLLNEAALVAARRDKKAIDKLDVDEAHDRVIAGPAKKDRAISEKERKMVAFHEAGHTIVGMVLSDARVVHKVTIVPRGRAGGYAIMLPKEDRFLMTKKELFEQVVGLLGGRAAEEFIFNEKTTGASNDFEQATGIVRSMITEYGMYDELGTVQYEGNHQVFIGRDYGQTKAYSDQVAFEIDNAVRSIMKEAYAQALQILEEHKEQLTLIAEKLLELETLDERTIKALFETGEMPTEDVEEEEYPSEVEAASFEEAKKALAKREASKQDSEEESDSKDDVE